MTRSDLSFFYAESHRSTIVTTAPSASPEPITAPESGAAFQDDGQPKPGLRKEKEVSDPPLVNRETNADTIDVPPYPPALQSITDSNGTNLSRSLQGPQTEHAGEHLPNPSRNKYDMV